MNVCKITRHFPARLVTAGLIIIALPGMTLTVRSADAPITLRAAFKEHFLVGTAGNRSMVTGTTFRRSAERAAEDVALVKEQFNQITAENDMKWALIHPKATAK